MPFPDEKGSHMSRDEPHLLQFTNVSFRYGTAAKYAISDISFAVRRSHTLALVGESGSGKSTIGKIAVGTLQPVTGLVDRASASGEAQGRVAIVHQSSGAAMDPRLTVEETLRNSLRYSQVLSPRLAPERIREVAEAVGISKELFGRRAHQLSGGQRQRVGIARAIVTNPDVLVADEPTSALDVSIQARVLELLADLQQQLKFACVFITHDLAVAGSVADEVMVLRGGETVEQGSADSVLGQPQTEYARELLAASTHL